MAAGLLSSPHYSIIHYFFENINASLFQSLKGIDRSFELRGEIRFIRSVMTNWRLGIFFYLILNGLHHKISKKPIVAA